MSPLERSTFDGIWKVFGPFLNRGGFVESSGSKIKGGEASATTRGMRHMAAHRLCQKLHSHGTKNNSSHISN